MQTIRPMPDDLTALSARAAVALLRAGDVSPREMVEAALSRIEAVDGPLNALPTLCAERALAHADAADRQSALSGLPIAVKDLTEVAGVRTTHGSPIYADNVPERSDIVVEHLEERGAVVVAKSNTPEFGAGGQTFNEVFGPTRNPWDTSRTCGGSSGGSAVALATRQVWLATGSDLGGSLRTPASFCSVVGLRPSPGRIARAGRAAVRHADGGGADGARRRRRRAHARRHGRAAPQDPSRSPLRWSRSSQPR